MSFATLRHDWKAASRTSGGQEVDRLWRYSTIRHVWSWKMGDKYRGSSGCWLYIWQISGNNFSHDAKWLSNVSSVWGEMIGARNDWNRELTCWTMLMVVSKKWEGALVLLFVRTPES